MTLNPNKTKTLVVRLHVNPLHGNLVLARVSIRAGPNLDILGVMFDSKLTFNDHARCIVSRVSQRIGILRLVKRVFVDTSVLLRCYTMHLSSQLLSIVLRCGSQLLNVTLSLSSFRWPGFVCHYQNFLSLCQRRHVQG